MVRATPVGMCGGPRVMRGMECVCGGLHATRGMECACGSLRAVPGMRRDRGGDMSTGRVLFMAGVILLAVMVVLSGIMLIRQITGKRRLDQYIKDNY